jgi:hypothetical protein
VAGEREEGACFAVAVLSACARTRTSALTQRRLRAQICPLHVNFEATAAACKQKARALLHRVVATGTRTANASASQVAPVAHLLLGLFAPPQVFQKAVREAQHFEATGGASGGELPSGMTGEYEPTAAAAAAAAAPPKARAVLRCAVLRARAFAADVAPPAQSAKSVGKTDKKRGAAQGGGGKRGGGVPRRIKIARLLGLLPPAADGPSPIALAIGVA